MAKKNKNERTYSIHKSTKRLRLIYIIVAFAILAAIIAFAVLSFITKDRIYTALLLGSFVVFVLMTIVFGYVLFNQSYTSLFTDLIDNTRENYQKISNMQQKLNKYENNQITELRSLNSQVDEINDIFSNTVMLSTGHLYDNLKLDYLSPDDKHAITIDSFLSHYKGFILANEVYRNALVYFTYDVNDDEDFLSGEDYLALYKVIILNFPGEGVLAAKDTKRHGFIVFIPKFDSLRVLYNGLETVCKYATVSKQVAGGLEVKPLKAAAVVYPYSDMEDLMSDLRYAMRQNKDINIYTPDRLNKENMELYHTSMNLNNIAKLFEMIAKANISVDDTNSSKVEYHKALRGLANHLGFEHVGMITLDTIKEEYFVDYEWSKNEGEHVFKEVNVVADELVDLIKQEADYDNTLAFSNRLNVNKDLGRLFDIYGLRSGFIFLVKTDSGQVTGIIYYLNKTKDMTLTAYDKESLVVFSAYVADFFRRIYTENEIHTAQRRYKSILRLTDFNVYSVDSDTYELTELSDGLIDAFGNYKHGQKCYEKLYGLEAPCEDCPLLKNVKKTSMIGKREYITSTILNRKKEQYPTLLMSPVESKGESAVLNRYDPQLFIHSFYGFNEEMERVLQSKTRGYVLFVSVDNADSLLKEYGEEGYQTRLRYFFRNYRRDKKYGDGEIYLFRPDTFAFIFPEDGRVDILDRVEKIYSIAKTKYDEKAINEISLNCTYFAFEYPQDYHSASEFFHSVNLFIKDNYKLFNQENFILADSGYVRLASREQFILSLLDNAIKTESLSLKYLPEVRSANNKIVGAEVLLRLTDKFRNAVLSPYEFIPVASKHGKIGTITEYLINRVGEIYQKYGISAFKVAGLKSLSLNVDIPYFEDESFLSRIDQLINKYHFPKGFLRFEFGERDIANNFELIKALSKKITNLDIYLTADNYTGAFISIDKLKQVGFKIVKLSRNLIMDLANDGTKINGVKSIMQDIKEYDMSYCIVGLETKLQYQLLSEIDKDFLVEGYYFYQPMDIDELLSRLKLMVA